MRALLQAFEKELKPIFDQLQNVKGIDAPDYGSLTDWAIAQRAAEAAKARDGNPLVWVIWVQLPAYEFDWIKRYFDGCIEVVSHTRFFSLNSLFFILP